MWKRWILAVSATFLATRPARAAEIPETFLISKSENKNQIHYAVRVDDACRPAGANPVQPYWRMLEQNAINVERILPREERIYGIAEQRVDGSAVRIRLRALPSRPITITTSRSLTGKCVASTTVPINGKPARLFDIHIAMNLLGVDHLLVTGWADDGTVVRERIDR